MKQLHITESVLKTKGWTSWDWDMKNAELRSWNWTNCIFFQLSNPNHPFKLLIGMSGRVLDHMFFLLSPGSIEIWRVWCHPSLLQNNCSPKTRCRSVSFVGNCLGCSLSYATMGETACWNALFYMIFGSQDDTPSGCITLVYHVENQKRTLERVNLRTDLLSVSPSEFGCNFVRYLGKKTSPKNKFQEWHPIHVHVYNIHILIHIIYTT